MDDSQCHIWSSNDTFAVSNRTSDEHSPSNRPRMWSTVHTDSSLNTSSKASLPSQVGTGALHLSTSTTPFAAISQLNLPYQQPGLAKPGRLENLAQALENEFTLGFSTTDCPVPSSRPRDTTTPLGNIKVAAQPSLTFSAPEYGLDPIEGSFVIQGLRPKQGTHAFSSRFQLLLERKLQAELAAKAQQDLVAQQQRHGETGQPCTSQFAANQAFDPQQPITTNTGQFDADLQTQILHSDMLGQMSQALANADYPMSANMRGPQSGSHQTHGNPATLSNYHVLSSTDAYASRSTAEPSLGPPAVQASYQPAPFRSQHYQRLLAAKLANSGQSGPESASSLVMDGAASFMQHWTDHTLDPNYPTPQEMSFLPSSHSPLYQLFNSGYGQDQWQTGGYQDDTLRHATGVQNLNRADDGGRYDPPSSSNNARQIWPVDQLQQPDGGSASVPVLPFYSTSEHTPRYTPWLNPYGQGLDDSDATSTQSSRAPGQNVAQQSASVLSQSSVPVLPTPPGGPAREPSLQNTKDSGHESSSPTQRTGGDTGGEASNELGEDGEPKKAVLACHFCRGRKLKCDGTRPTCAHCEKRGLSCSYDAQIRRRGPGKRKREQLAILAAAEGKLDDDGTPLLHKLLAPKPKGKRGRKPKNRNTEGEVVDNVKPSDDPVVRSKANDTEDPPYARPPNPYLPSYFIPDHKLDSPLLGHGVSHAAPSHYLPHQSHLGQSHHLNSTLQHQVSSHPNPYQPAYHAPVPWPEEMDNVNKRQRTEQYPMGGRW